MRPLSKTTITTITSLLTTGHSYASIKAQTGASAGAITKICQDYCPEVAVSPGGRPKKLTTANILYTKCAIRTVGNIHADVIIILGSLDNIYNSMS